MVPAVGISYYILYRFRMLASNNRSVSSALSLKTVCHTVFTFGSSHSLNLGTLAFESHFRHCTDETQKGIHRGYPFVLPWCRQWVSYLFIKSISFDSIKYQIRIICSLVKNTILSCFCLRRARGLRLDTLAFESLCRHCTDETQKGIPNGYPFVLQWCRQWDSNPHARKDNRF